MGVLVSLVLSAQTGTPAKKKLTPKSGAVKTGAKKSPAKKGAASTAKKGTVTAASHKKAPAKKTTWRNRQLNPSPERYHEIQDALVAKGYLKSEDANGTWNQNSIDALKRFQGEQNLEPSGKINSLSLIALGLGPKHDATLAAAPPAPAKQ